MAIVGIASKLIMDHLPDLLQIDADEQWRSLECFPLPVRFNVLR